MSHSHIRQQVAHYLAQQGSVEDPRGRATAKLRDALGYEGSEASFTQLISNMDRAGQLTREVKGKRTYRIVGVEQAAQVDHDSVADRVDPEDSAMDYDAVASALLVQVVQTVAKGNQAKDADGSWARRRIERLERRIGELERELSVAKAESRTLAAERDQLGLQLEHSEGIPLRLLQKPHLDSRSERRKAGSHQVSGGLVIQRTQLQLRESGPLEETLLTRPTRGEKTQASASQPSSDEPQHAGAGAIKPRQVVHNQYGASFAAGPPEKIEGRVGYEQAVRGRPVTESEGDVERSPMGRAQLGQPFVEREERLMQA